jgi:hypothetical protein
MAIIDALQEVLHTIRVFLYYNYLQNVNGKYVARIKSDRTLDLEEVVAAAINRGGALLPRDTMLEAYRIITKEILYQVLDGFKVNTGFFMIALKIRGTYNGLNEPVEKTKLSFSITPLAWLRSLIDKVTVEILGIADVDAYVAEVFDNRSGLSDTVLTPDGDLIIQGYKVKVAGNDPTCGVAFIDTATGTAYPVTERLTENTPSRLIVRIPALNTGVYNLRIISQYTSGTKTLKEPRITTYSTDLEVQ